MTFFTAPPSSQPTTSVLVYGRKYGVWQAAWSRWATPSSVQATTAAAGLPGGDLPARLGPVTHGDPVAADLGDVLDRPRSSAWPCRVRRPSSARRARCPGASSGAHSARLPRSVCEGMARTVKSAPRGRLGGVGGRAQVRAGVRRRGGSRGCVRRGVDRFGEFGAARPTGSPRSPRRRAPCAKAVPQEPVPKTAAFTALLTCCSPRGAPCPLCLWLRPDACPSRGLAGAAALLDPLPARVVGRLGRLLAADLLQLAGDGGHDDLGGLLQHVRGRSPCRRTARGPRAGRPAREGLARESRSGLLGVRRQQFVGAPLRDGNHRAPWSAARPARRRSCPSSATCRGPG